MTWLKAIGERYRVTADPLRTERRVELVAVLLTLLLILQVVIGASSLAIMSTPEEVLPTADSLEVIQSLGPEAVSAQQSNEIRNRPLLWPERRPVEAIVEVAETQKAGQQSLKGVKLLGVFGEGDSVGIIVLVKDKTSRIRLGEEVTGWKLESVASYEAVFTSGTGQKKVTLPQPKKLTGKPD